MHPYLQSKAAQAHIDELIRQAEHHRRTDPLDRRVGPGRRLRWRRLLSLFGTNRRRDRRRVVTPRATGPQDN